MSNFMALYLAWAVPSVIVTLATATVAWWLLTIGRTRSAQHFFIAIGAPVLVIVIISAIASAISLAPLAPGSVIGIMAGVICPLLLRPAQ